MQKRVFLGEWLERFCLISYRGIVKKNSFVYHNGNDLIYIR
jgi:hypothetical protein